MTPRATRYPQTAERNRRFAEAALADPDQLPTLREWAAVAAFCSAVHYVNACFYEQQQFEPQNHGQRYAAITQHADLRVIRRSYQELNDAGYRARYDPMYLVSDAALRRLVDVKLQEVSDEVERLLASGT